MNSPDRKVRSVFVTFAAKDGDPYPRARDTGEFVDAEHEEPMQWGPTLRAVGDRRSMLYGSITDVYYLCHPAESGGKRKKGRTAQEVAKDMVEALKRHLGTTTRPQFHTVLLNAHKPPNNHQELYELTTHQLREIRRKHPGVEIVLQLDSGTAAMHAVLLLAGSVGVVDGPIRLVQAERGEGARLRPQQPVVDVGLEVQSVLRIARQSVSIRTGVDEMASVSFDRARSPALVRALSEAQEAARVPFPILLRGERGVGKSTIAGLIRAASPFRKPLLDKAWPSVACGQFTDADRLNAELCGTLKGAFTGAVEKWGLLKRADGDTLFLDEIQDLDARSQRVLIRVIEEGTYYRLGEDRPQKSKFRLICGTNQPDTILFTKLSADFYDRIRDIEIEIPPIRDCREDLPWMWEESWIRVAPECGLRPELVDRELHGAVLNTLLRLPLFGNWRDLRRLAVRLAASMTAIDAKERDPHGVLSAFAKEQCGTSRIQHDALDAVLLTKRDIAQHSRLEQNLGSGLDRFWSMCETQPPAHVLEKLLGDRHRAKRAIEFIRRTHPVQWEQLSKASPVRN